MTRPLRAALFGVTCVGVFILSGATPVDAQLEGDPIVPRGSVLFRLVPSLYVMDGLYAPSGGQTALGAFFSVPVLGVEDVPSLASEETRFHALAGPGSAPPLQLGRAVGRFALEEHSVPIGVTYGVLDRLAVGVTVPFVRRQVDAVLRYSPLGANVGMNPGTGATGEFLAQASGALAAARTAVDGLCAGAGEADPQCTSGRGLVAEVDGFLTLLGASFGSGVTFPLTGSALGVAVANRWAALVSGLGAWNAQAPADLPLATAVISSEVFRQAVVEPAWSGGGLPLGTPETYFDLGDIEVHGAVRLLDIGTAGESPTPFTLRSHVVGTYRLPTGTPDSLRALAPGSTTHGTGGMDVRLESEAGFRGRVALSGFIELGWHGERDMFLIAPDPSLPFAPGQTRASVTWAPGSHVRAGIVPRLVLGSTLAVGVGWHLFRQEADTFTLLPSTGPSLPSPRGARTVQSVTLDLRYSVRDPPTSDRVRFPLEAFLRLSRSFSGSGEWSPVEQRVEAGLSLLFRRQ